MRPKLSPRMRTLVTVSAVFGIKKIEKGLVLRNGGEFVNFFAKKVVAAVAPAEAAAPLNAPPQDAPAVSTPAASGQLTYGRIDLNPAETAAGAPSTTSACTGEDYEEFITYLRVGKRPYRRTGVSVKEEFEHWFADRTRGLRKAPERKASGLSSFLQVHRNLN
jgi:hypothetical protein